ncbi:hypothetical protein H8356DRAFT_961963, partial [Neocallimastix lanati (nom. inval.)]
MKYLFNDIYTIVFWTIIVLFSKIYSEKITINILMKQPDMPESINAEKWEENYNTLINNFLSEEYKNNNTGGDSIEVLFSFYKYRPVNEVKSSEYLNFIQDGIEAWMNSKYDMAIIDDRILFSDDALIESLYVIDNLYTRIPTKDYILNLSDYIEQKDIEHHVSNIRKHTYFKEDLYALPYERDFDLLYFNMENEISKTIIESMKFITWDDLLVLMKEKSWNSLNIALGDEDDQLNFFFEYINSKFNLSLETTQDYYNQLYNDKKSKEILNSFRDFSLSMTSNNLNRTLSVSLDNAYRAFLNNDALFFKGKASHYHFINNLNSINISLPPKYYSAVTEKYLVLNKYSKVNPKLLVDIALKLTSLKMQLLRANYFGSIPTFDISPKNSNTNIKSFCDKYSEICDTLERIHPIYLKDIFKSEYSVPFFETRFLLPSFIRRFLRNNDIESLQFALKSIKELITTNLGIYDSYIYIIVLIYVIFSFFIIAMTYKYRNHPYLKVISPMFCILMIIGFIMNMLSLILLFLPPYSITKCKISILYETLNPSLIYIPIFAVTYRLYRVFKSQTVYTRSLTNKNLYIAITFVFLIVIIYKIILMFTNQFYYISYGSIGDYRYPQCFYDGYELHDSIDEFFFISIIITIIYMIIKINKISKKYGELNYIYIIFSLTIINNFVARKIITSKSKDFALYYLLLTILDTTACFICVYYLVGSRLYFI